MNQYPGGPPHQGSNYPPPHPSRRQDYPYAPSPHPPYIPYYAPSSPHPAQIPYGPPQHYMPPMHQWYPYQQYAYPPQPHPPPQHPRHYQQQQQHQQQQQQQHYSPLVVSSTNQQPVLPVNRQHPPPAPPTTNQAPPPISQTPVPDQSTTSSTTSQQVASPSTTPITNSDITATPPINPYKTTSQDTTVVDTDELVRQPFTLQLPWCSVPEASFPARFPRRRRRRAPQTLPDTPTFPRQQTSAARVSISSADSLQEDSLPDGDATTVSATFTEPSTSHSTPVSSQHLPAAASQSISASTTLPKADVDSVATLPGPQQQIQHKRALTRPVVPALPNIPRRPAASVETKSQSGANQRGPNVNGQPTAPSHENRRDSQSEVDSATPSDLTQSPPAARAPPKSWAELLRSKNAANASSASPVSATNGVDATKSSLPSSGSLSDTLRSYEVQNGGKISFLEPRGLVNTGNMCYMNSILQVLAFCVPFFELLDQVRKRAVHSFKSITPLLEAMIMFMNEYSIIDSAASVEQLRLRLKDNELEQYGEAFIPEYVYEAIKNIPRFSSMRRGQQQDAEEFLGLLLEVLHLECLAVIDKAPTNSTPMSQVNGDKSVSPSGNAADGWMEVQRHQKPAVTQTSGTSASSPITKIFGGALRSEFRVSGNKNSVTMTPYQQLQLDINDPAITNITHALKGLTRSEKVDGQFTTARGTASHGTKQFFIETLPPVLILHLKRFHYDNVLGSTQKIWKRVGYPLDLEIPKEAFAPSKRAQYAARPQGMPRYRLSAVVYHHGKNASGGHYTVDVRRQEGKEWIRLDDTVIRRLQTDDVASEGGEEDPKILAAALERHKKEEQNRANNKANPYMLNDDAETDNMVAGEGTEGWSQVIGNGVTSPPASSAGSKKWSGVVTNGTTGTNSTGTATPTGKKTPRDARGAGSKGLQSSAKDKVAYILFYERVQE